MGDGLSQLENIGAVGGIVRRGNNAKKQLHPLPITIPEILLAGVSEGE